MRKGTPLKPRAVLPHLKSRATDMKNVRQRRKDAGLVEFRAWVTPEQREAIQLALKDIQASTAYSKVIDKL